MPSHALHALSAWKKGEKSPWVNASKDEKISANEISSLDLRLQAARRLYQWSDLLLATSAVHAPISTILQFQDLYAAKRAHSGIFINYHS